MMEERNEPLATNTPKKRRTDSEADAHCSFSSKCDNADSILFYSEDNVESLLFYSADTKDESILFYSPSSHETGCSYQSANSGEVLSSDLEEPITMTTSQLLEEPCCQQGCLKYLSPVEARQAREHFTSKTAEEQRQYLLDCASVSTLSTSSGIPKLTSFTLFGKNVCKKAFALVLDCSTRRLDRVAALLREGVTKISHRNVGQLRQTSKTADAIAWMDSYFRMIGKHLPDCDRIHLPSFLAKRDVYERMVAELRENGLSEGDIISLSTFYSVWESNFAKVMIPEVSCCTYGYVSFDKFSFVFCKAHLSHVA